jgi:Putative esterase
MKVSHIPAAAALCALTFSLATTGAAFEIEISIPSELEDKALDGRVILLISTDSDTEPRFQTRPGIDAIQIFGVDVDDLAPGRAVRIDAKVSGYPIASLDDLPPGEYQVQAVLHRYETFHRSDGHTVKMPMDRGEGQQWNRAPGNLYSSPREVTVTGNGDTVVHIELDLVIPPIEPPADTEYVRHIRIQSKLLSDFWGRPMYLGAHVLLPHGFEEHPDARYPLMISHGHFPHDLGGFRTSPPDPDIECEYSPRFQVDCYNRIQQEEAYAFYKQWISPGFPRFLVIEIQHANPFYDDSYAVNSANLGPYGDAITHELIPYIEQEFRGLGEGWARFLYGGSTGGWEALAVQIFYPDDYNGAFAACPDPIDFRAYLLTNIYEDSTAYFEVGPFHRIDRPSRRDWLGRVTVTMQGENLWELVLGAKNRSGQQFDIWEAVYSPTGDDGYPRRLWAKETGIIDAEVAAHWRDNYDLRFILERDWARLGPKLEGKIHIFVGDMDNYYLNNAVYLMEEFLESTNDPYYAGEIDYGDRAEHCWNGDHENGNHISRLRYNTMYLPRILERIEATAPEGADLTSWRY